LHHAIFVIVDLPGLQTDTFEVYINISLFPPILLSHPSYSSVLQSSSTLLFFLFIHVKTFHPFLFFNSSNPLCSSFFLPCYFYSPFICLSCHHFFLRILVITKDKLAFLQILGAVQWGFLDYERKWILFMYRFFSCPTKNKQNLHLEYFIRILTPRFCRWLSGLYDIYTGLHRSTICALFLTRAK
jgi:hypothetical protein